MTTHREFLQNIAPADMYISMYRELRANRGLGARGALSVANGDLLWLPRAAVVASISALDGYMHSMLYERVPQILASPDVPDPLCELMADLLPIRNAAGFKAAVPLLQSPHTLTDLFEKLRDNKLAFLSYQAPDKINAGFALIGQADVFGSVAGMWPGPGMTADRIKRNLNNYVKRRNQIAHEADAEASGLSRPIQPDYAADCAEFIRNLTWRLHRVAYGV